MIQVDKNEISPVALTNIAAVFYVKETCHRMACFFNDAGQRQYAPVIVFQKDRQGMLHQRQAGRRLEIGLLFFSQGMGGVVRGDDIDAVVV